MLMWVNVGIFLFGLVMAPLFVANRRRGAMMVLACRSWPGLRTAGHVLVRALSHHGRLLRQLADLQLAGIFGARSRLAATYCQTYGLQYVGYYLCAARPSR